MIKKTIFFLSIFLIQSSFSQAQTINPVEKEEKTYASPENFVESFIDESLNFVNSQNLSVAEQEKNLIELSRRYFDNKKISKLILGVYFKEFSEDQFAEFVTYFELSIVKNLVVLLNKSENIEDVIIEFKLNRTRERKGRKFHTLSGFIQTPKNPEPITAELLVAEKESEYKIINITILNVNYVINLRNTYSSMIHSKGIDGLLSHLKEQTEI